MDYIQQIIEELSDHLMDIIILKETEDCIYIQGYNDYTNEIEKYNCEKFHSEYLQQYGVTILSELGHEITTIHFNFPCIHPQYQL